MIQKIGFSFLTIVVGLLMVHEANANPGKIALEIIKQNCVDCHGGFEVNADVDFKLIRNLRHLRGAPELIDRVINAVSDKTMPPEDSELLEEQTRLTLIDSLKAVLREIEFDKTASSGGMMRLNRFQYNNTVKDLLQLKQDVFALPEKLITRHTPYLKDQMTEMPATVQVESLALRPRAGLQGVKPFPKDSRASHGFDNQDDVLTLSPLLLDAFLRLSVSIVDSPDFTPENVGVWNELFSAEIDTADLEGEIRQRLKVFLRRAFRRPVDTETLDRYTAYALSHHARGLDLTGSMKKVVSAILSSPRFFYRSWSLESGERQFEIAASLAYTLWGSCPDDTLLDLAAKGELADESVLRQTIANMMSDSRVERFMDSFPVQWMQLETLMAVTPDPTIDRYFSLDGQFPATVQMVLEPLLLFDTIYVEDRSVGELLAPSFSYHSPFLTTWYEGNMKPPAVDAIAINLENEGRGKAIADQQLVVEARRKELAEIEQAINNPVASGLAEVDLAAGQAAWEKTQTEKIAGEAMLSPWHRIGPFPATSLDDAHQRAFIDEAAVDLKKEYGEKKWELFEDLTDGKAHQLIGGNCTHYLYRTVKTEVARSLEVSIGSDDSFKLWLNGVLIGQHNEVRGLAPDQNKLRLELAAGENSILFKVSNGGGGYGFYFRANSIPLPLPIVAALKTPGGQRDDTQKKMLADYYLAIAPELREVRAALSLKKDEMTQQVQAAQQQLDKLPKPKSVAEHQADAQRGYDQHVRNLLRSQHFTRVEASDPRFGGIITNAAMLSMTSGPKRTHPVARGVWITEVIFNDPPSPPPNDIPPLNEEAGPADLTIRERFAAHREHASCAGCHAKLDPLGFALENFDITGRWRDSYANGRDVDATGTLMRTYDFADILQFKKSLVSENDRFARAFVSHLLRFAESRELEPHDSVVIDQIVVRTRADGYRLRAILEEVLYHSVQ